MLAVRLLGRWKRRGRKGQTWKMGARSRGKAGLWGRMSFGFRDTGRRRERQGEGLRRLKRRLGDLSVATPAQAASVQATIEDSLGGELSFAVQPGDVVLSDSDTLARCTPPGLAARRGIHRSATWDGGGELELLQKHLQTQAAAAVKSKSSTLGSFNRLKKTERGDQRGTAAGPLVILTPPPSSTSAPTATAPGDSGSPSELGHRMESQPLSNVQPSPSSLNAPSGSESLKTSLLSFLNIDLFSKLHLGKHVSR